MNVVQLVGYIANLPQTTKEASAKAYSRFEVEVVANFRDATGVFQETRYPVQLWRGASATIMKTAKVDDLISVKGRLERIDDEVIVVAEHIEFLHLK